MSLSRLLIVLRHRWRVVLALSIVGATLGFAATHLVTPVYTSTTKLYVSGVGGTSSDRLQSGEYARSRVSSYADMIGSADVLDAVRSYLGRPPTGENDLREVATTVTATNPMDTSVIDVTVQASSPQLARQVAVAIGAVANGVVGRLESPPDGAQSPVRLSVASPAMLPVHRDSPSVKVYGAGGLLAGALLGLGVGALLDSRRVRRSSRGLVVQPLLLTSNAWSWWPNGSGRSGSRSAAPSETSEVA